MASDSERRRGGCHFSAIFDKVGSSAVIKILMESSPRESQLPKTIWKTERKETVRNLALLLFVVALIVCGSFFISIEELAGLVARAGFWGPLLLVLLKASTIIFAPLSGSPLYPLAGAVFGGWWGLLYIVLGDMLGATVSFWISRLYGRKLVARLLSKSNLAFLETALSYMGTLKGFLIARVLFSPLPEVASYGAGLTKLPFVPFFLIHSSVGLVPASMLVWFGASLALAAGPLGIIAILLAGSLAAGLGVLIFFFFVQPKALMSAAADSRDQNPRV
ncbi:MAG: VTT domain-containing protein [Patescibacteria group bacterium]